uniref:SLED domain-containing protein n=1 Tax=Denticeps clupeoides TaxID=299321 RepID=A0AAY4DZF6_9TELE
MHFLSLSLSLHLSRTRPEAESGEEDMGFNWEEFLEENGATAAPHTSFKHVELSLQSSFQPGMKLEVANKSSPDTYWVATIITTCGQLLLLRYSGYGDDRKADFWCDVMAADLHPVGWCAQNNRVLMPPEAIKEKHSDWTEFLIQDLTGSRTAPANLLEGPMRGKNTVDLIVKGCVLELQSDSEPDQYWPVQVLQNIGGRLCLRYAGLDDQSHNIWLFYLDTRLRPVGWALENNLTLQPTTELRDLKSDHEWQDALDTVRAESMQRPLPLEVFKDHADLRKHSFKVGMKLEMVSQGEPLQICPVSVSKVYSEYYFQVTLDDLTAEGPPCSVVRHAESLGILPVQWCLKNGVGLEQPRGFLSQDFDWADYLKQSGTEAAPDSCFPDVRLLFDMWLEAVNPWRPSELCVACITQVKGRLLWLRLEGLTKPVPECIVDSESMDIFPVGWCEANGYPLTPPVKPVCRKVAVVQPEKQYVSPELLSVVYSNGKYCCSQIFVNHRCFSGPYLNKGRIAELPQAVGPGKCTLVLKEVLSMVINAAYKPGRVLRELQMLEDPQWDFQEETLKAKYKGKSYRSTIKIVRVSDQVPDFCKKVCMKLQCCPNLFSPNLVTDECSLNCSVQTKTKYTYYYGKKKKVGRPSLGESTLENEMTKPARRRKKRKSIFVQKKRRSSTVDYTAAGSSQVSSPHRSPDDDDAEDQSITEEDSSSEPRDDHIVVSSRGRPRYSKFVILPPLPPPSPTHPLTFPQDIDGQALLLLTLPTVQECMDLKLGPAIKLCHQIERVKVAFYAQYAN